MTQGYELGVAQDFAIGVPASSVTLTPSLVEPQAPGTAITWTALASGGQAPYTYRFILWDGAAWSDLRGWDASNAFTWTPTVANPDYKVAVLVRSAWNTGPNEISVTTPFAIRRFATSVTLYKQLAPPQALGTPLDFTASAAGGQAPALRAHGSRAAEFLPIKIDEPHQAEFGRRSTCRQFAREQQVPGLYAQRIDRGEPALAQPMIVARVDQRAPQRGGGRRRDDDFIAELPAISDACDPAFSAGERQLRKTEIRQCGDVGRAQRALDYRRAGRALDGHYGL